MSAETPPAGVFYRFTVLALMACVVGAVVSLLALLFVECVGLLNDWLLISPRSRIFIQDDSLLNFLTLLVPTGGGLLVGWMLWRYSVDQRPLGPPDSIRAVQLRQGLPHWRSGVVSTVAAAVSLGCGASVGQYGPMVYLGSMLGGLAAKLRLRIPNLHSIALACGVAAAISAAFNAPIAGLIFAHEVILRHYSLQAFAPTTVAAATGFIVANVVFERPALFLVHYEGVVHGYEFGLFALLGICCALLATFFMRLILRLSKLSQSLAVHPVLKPALAGFIVGMVALALPDTLGTGQEVLRFATIEGAFENRELAWLVAAKLGLTALCVAFGFAGGVFSPSLLIGVLFGALYWSVLTWAGVPNSGVAVYAVCGMMALCSPVIGAPLTTILIVFELTRNYELTIAAMVAVVFANLLAYRLFGRSLFDIQLAGKGVDLSSGRDRAMLENLCIEECAVKMCPTIEAGHTVQQAIDRFSQEKRSEIVVVNSGSQYLGILRLQDIIAHSPQNIIDEYLINSWPSFTMDTSIWQAMQLTEGFVGEMIPVVSADTGQLQGGISEAQLIEAYLEIVHGLRREENAAV